MMTGGSPHDYGNPHLKCVDKNGENDGFAYFPCEKLQEGTHDKRTSYMFFLKMFFIMKQRKDVNGTSNPKSKHGTSVTCGQNTSFSG